MKRLLLLALLLLWPVPSFAAGTATLTSAAVRDLNTRYVKYRVAWTATAGGAVSGNTITVAAGRIVSVRFVPGTAGTQPTDQYDVTVIDTNSVDVVFGAGANLSNAASTVTRLSPAYFQDGTRVLDVVVANAGDSKTGVVELLVQVQ